MRRLICLALLLLLGCAEPEPLPPEEPPNPRDAVVGPYAVDVRWDTWGVPHILADDFGSLAYGFGYAQARHHACTILDQIVMVRSERARYFGAGVDDAHVDSDFGLAALDLVGHAERGWFELEPVMQQTLVGFAAGINRAVDEGVPAACAGEPWVRAIDHIDLLTLYVGLAEFGSGAVLKEALARAIPPDGSREPSPAPFGFEELARRWQDSPMGSNGWAVGRDRTAGGGMLLSNTHFPHFGERRWFEAHLRIPGEIEVYGASLIGVAIINLGFNADVAWTHTVSGTPRFTLYRLRLDPDSPTRYERDGEFVDMTSRDHEIQVKLPDGSLVTERRTLYRSHHGPMGILDPAIWSGSTAYAVRDANEGNLATIPTWLGLNRSASLDDVEQAISQQGIPWVHTLATDAGGEVLFADAAAAPNLRPEAEAAFEVWRGESSLARQAWASGAMLFDGSDPVFEWVDAGGTRAPGLVPYEDAPTQRRTDYVANANDNHWLSNAEEPIEGAPWVFGAERTPRSPRTRMNLRYLSPGDPASGDDDRFSLAELVGGAMSARGLLEEELRPAVLARCDGLGVVAGEVDGDDVTADVGALCAALAAWDGRATVASQGAAAWREVLHGSPLQTDDFFDAGALWAEPFDANDPVATPRGLAPAGDDDPVRQALLEAAWRLAEAGVDPTAPLGDVQWSPKGEQRIGIPGGTGAEGLIAIASTSIGDGTLAPRHPDFDAPRVHARTGLREGGYPVGYGNSFILAVEFTDDGPQAEAVLTYSQSADPDSPFFADQTALYGAGGTRAVLWTEADVLADPGLATQTLQHPGD